MESERCVVSCKNLEFGYNPETRVLKGVNLILPEGALGVIFGKSGDGKTTLLKCLMGYLTPTSGMIEWSAKEDDPTATQTDDWSGVGDRAIQLIGVWRELSKQKTNRRMGLRRRLLYTGRNPSLMVFADSSNALPQLTAEENLRMALAPVCADVTLRERAISLLLEITDLEKVRSQKPQQLSTGQLRRLCLAQSLAVNPRLLVWDEPTGGLDSATKYELIRFIQDLRSAVRLPGIIVTHDVETALLLADVIFLFDDGRIAKTRSVDIPFPRSPQDLDGPGYRPLRVEMIRFLASESGVTGQAGATIETSEMRKVST